jgi:6-phosphogluconolactonase/glucosamine-6-phosphate isomerase/deaminase
MVSNSEIENQAITVDVVNSKGEKLETDKIFHITVSTGNKPPATSNDLLKNRSTADIETINKVTLDANIQYL